MKKIKEVLVVHTQNPNRIEVVNNLNGNLEEFHVPNIRFGNMYFGDTCNTDRLTIVGVVSESDKTLSVGISFASYPQNFNRNLGKELALQSVNKESSTILGRKPYAIVELDEFTQEAALRCLYAIHEDLISKSVKEVKRLVNSQIIK